MMAYAHINGSTLLPANFMQISFKSDEFNTSESS